MSQGIGMTRGVQLLGLVLIAATAAGCGKNLYLSDDEGAQRAETSALSDHPDELSLPYATGTRVNIEVKNLEDKSTIAQWKAESSNTAVLVVEKMGPSNDSLVFQCLAMGPGESTLRILDNKGEEKRKVTITVATPDGVRLFAHETLRILGLKASSFDSAEVKEVRALNQSTSVYAVGYFKGTQRLYGRGIIAVEAPKDIKVENRTTTNTASNEWLFISPAAETTGDLKLKSGAVALGTLPFASVGESAVTALTISQESAEGKKERDTVWVGVRGADAMGRPIDGVWTTWTVGGVAQVGQDGDSTKKRGDLLRFELVSSAAPRDAVATFGLVTAKTSIRTDKSWVMDTTHLGCAMGRRGGASSGVVAAFALVGLGLALRRRGRAR